MLMGDHNTGKDIDLWRVTEPWPMQGGSEGTLHEGREKAAKEVGGMWA